MKNFLKYISFKHFKYFCHAVLGWPIPRQSCSNSWRVYCPAQPFFSINITNMKLVISLLKNRLIENRLFAKTDIRHKIRIFCNICYFHDSFLIEKGQQRAKPFKVKAIIMANCNLMQVITKVALLLFLNSLVKNQKVPVGVLHDLIFESKQSHMDWDFKKGELFWSGWCCK